MTFWALFGLDSPAPPVPFKVTEQRTTRRKREDRPDNIVHYSGRPFVQTEDTQEGVFEDTLYIGQGQRTGEVSNVDLRIVQREGLDETRYRELKPLWAAGISALKASRSFHGKYGYGVRTLDDYWRAFSLVLVEAAPPPPAAIGERRKTGATSRTFEFSY